MDPVSWIRLALEIAAGVVIWWQAETNGELEAKLELRESQLKACIVDEKAMRKNEAEAYELRRRLENATSEILEDGQLDSGTDNQRISLADCPDASSALRTLSMEYKQRADRLRKLREDQYNQGDD